MQTGTPLLGLLRKSAWAIPLALAFLLGSMLAAPAGQFGYLHHAWVEPLAAATLMETTAGTTLLGYQGRIANPTTNVAFPDGSFGINFAIFDAASGGTQLWTEARSVEQQRGIINVLLGEVTPLPLTIFDGRDLYLQLQVNGETLAPRQRLAWVAYAINARKAETVIDNAITSAKIADGQVTSADIADGQVTATDLADGSGSGVDADLLDGRDASTFASATHTHPGFSPLAFGFINANASVASGTNNFSVTWNATQSWYEIKITGVNYFYADYATTVTAVCNGFNGITSTSSVSGNLIVKIGTTSNVNTQCPFQFVTFKP